MPLYICRKSVEFIRKVEDPESIEEWASRAQEEQTRDEAERIWYCEEVTDENPETTEEGEPMLSGNFCMWFRWWDGSYRKTESEREFFVNAYMPLSELYPDDDPTTRTTRQDIEA